MTQQNRHRLAALLAIIPGLLSIKEGGSVLLGLSTPAYHVLPWLLTYNIVLGFVSVISGIGIGMRRTWGFELAVTILSLHGLVLMVLIILFAFKEAVAPISILAMLFRTTVWYVIVVLLKGKSKEQTGNA
jgi:hypothetical protein